MTTNQRQDLDLVPEGGGHPAKLLGAAAEYVRAANHATVRWDGRADGLESGADAYDAAGALYVLTSRLPQLSRQLAEILTTAAGNGHLTGTADAPELAAAELRQAAGILTAASERLNTAWQTLGPVGGWLSAAARAAGGRPDWEDPPAGDRPDTEPNARAHPYRRTTPGGAT